MTHIERAWQSKLKSVTELSYENSGPVDRRGHAQCTPGQLCIGAPGCSSFTLFAPLNQEGCRSEAAPQVVWKCQKSVYLVTFLEPLLLQIQKNNPQVWWCQTHAISIFNFYSFCSKLLCKINTSQQQKIWSKIDFFLLKLGPSVFQIRFKLCANKLLV